MTQHDHATVMLGCYRCHLSAADARPVDWPTVPTSEQRRDALRQMVRDAEDQGLYDQPEADAAAQERNASLEEK